MRAIIVNNAVSTLASAITTTAQTSMTLTSAASFPALTAGQYFYATIVDSGNVPEIVKVTAVVSNVLTMVRAQDGTAARTFAAGAKVAINPCAVVFNELVAKDGVGATGTWAIDISGRAAIATQADNATLAADATHAQTATTQAEKDSTTAVATTAFADRLRSLASSTSTTTLALSDRGASVKMAADITVPAGVFAENDVVTLVNNTATTLNILAGSGLVLRFAGTALTGSRTFAQRGLATILFVSATEAIVSGAGVA